MTNQINIFTIATSHQEVANAVYHIARNVYMALSAPDSYTQNIGMVVANQPILGVVTERTKGLITGKEVIQQILDRMVARGLIKIDTNRNTPGNPCYTLGDNSWEGIYGFSFMGDLPTIFKQGEAIDWDDNHYNDPVKADVKAPTKPTGSIDPKDFQQALEYIALDFLHEGALKCRVNDSEDSYRMELIMRVKGTIMDHGLEFRLSKPLKGHFDIPSEISRVQLVRTNHPMEAELLALIMEFFHNPSH